MPNLTEQLTKRQFLIGETDIPDLSPSGGVYIQATPDELIVKWDNSNTMGDLMSGREEHEFRISRADIITIKALPKQSIHESDNSWSTDHYPEIIIIHKDPFEVVDNFTTKFRNSESYWIKALAKHLSQQFNLTIEQEQINSSE